MNCWHDLLILPFATIFNGNILSISFCYFLTCNIFGYQWKLAKYFCILSAAKKSLLYQQIHYTVNLFPRGDCGSPIQTLLILCWTHTTAPSIAYLSCKILLPLFSHFQQYITGGVWKKAWICFQCQIVFEPINFLRDLYCWYGLSLDLQHGLMKSSSLCMQE